MSIKRPIWLFYKVYVFGVFYVTLIPFYPIFIYHLRKPERWERCFKWQLRWGRVVRGLSGLRLSIEGGENIPNSTFVAVSNHASYIDTFLMYGILPNYFSFIGMAGLERLPMFGRFFRSGQNIPVNRKSFRESVQAFNKAKEKINDGIPVALFPEGGIKPSVPKLAPFKSGAFKLAIEAQVPIVAMVMHDTHKLLESNDVFKTVGKPGTTKVKIFKAFETKGLTMEDLIPLRNKIHQIMSDELERNNS